MDLDLVFLGTGGSVPSARRSTASVLVRRAGERLLFDCGEGTQRQMQRSVGLVPVDAVFLTHFHLDHYLGLPGLVKTYELQGRTEPLRIYAPRGLHALWEALRPMIGKVAYPLDMTELEPGEAVSGDGYAIHPFAVEHRTRAVGYALVEDPRPGRFDAEEAKRLGVPEGPLWGELQRGQPVDVEGETISPDQLVGPDREGRKVVITGDTAPAEATRVAAHQADVLVHDASFADEEAERAQQTGHSTAREAARLAADAEVRFCCLVHISSRYNVREVLAEAREEYPGAEAPRDFDLVEVPFSERGEPRLVQNGARERPNSP